MTGWQYSGDRKTLVTQVSLLAGKERFSCLSKRVAWNLTCKLAGAILWPDGKSCAFWEPSWAAGQAGQVVLTWTQCSWPISGCSRMVWMELWEIWSREKYPHPWQGNGTRWALRSFPSQAILWPCDPEKESSNPHSRDHCPVMLYLGHADSRTY